MKKYPNARFYEYNTEEAEDIAQELGVNMMPTVSGQCPWICRFSRADLHQFHIFKDGEVMQTVTGAKGAALEKAIKENYEK